VSRAAPYLMFVLALALLLFQAHRNAQEIEQLKDRRAVEFAAAVAEGVARTLRPAPPVCVQYRVHMEPWTITHCMNPKIRM
jgi:hypothetical protein